MTQLSAQINTEAIHEEFQRQFTDELHSCATLAVFRDGLPLIELIQGARHARPMFRVFSMGKPLASAVLWRYRARNQFDWDTPLVEFWPEFGTRGKAGITIGHVLSHTAGLPSHSSIPVIDYTDWGRVIAHIEDMAPETKPGSTVHYHARTFGWLVAEIVSRVSGLAFEEAFAREVTYPLGLRSTAFTVGPSDFGRVVPLELSNDWEDRNAGQNMDAVLHSRVLLPAGSLLTTAQDAAKFYAVLSGKGTIDGVPWLPAGVIEEVTDLRAEGIDQSDGNHYSRLGLGVRLPSQPPNPYASNNDLRTVGHGGLGTCTGWASLDSGVSFAYITNRLQIDEQNRNRLHRMSLAVRKSLGLDFDSADEKQ